MVEKIRNVQSAAEAWSAEELLRWSLEEFQSGVAISTAFGAEGIVIIDMAAQFGSNIRVFTVDTDFLFPETYDLIHRIEKRYGIHVERLRSTLTPEEQSRQHGEALWAHEPDRCCNLRKIEPLKKKLANLRAWITGIRRDQTPTRAKAGKLEWDSNFGLVKINPIADWSSHQVWEYVRRNNLPYNPLHDRNYPSIGCTHCTRAVRPGEDSRAGRWAGFQKTECGLHVKKNNQVITISAVAQ